MEGSKFTLLVRVQKYKKYFWSRVESAVFSSFPLEKQKKSVSAEVSAKLFLQSVSAEAPGGLKIEAAETPQKQKALQPHRGHRIPQKQPQKQPQKPRRNSRRNNGKNISLI